MKKNKKIGLIAIGILIIAGIIAILSTKFVKKVDNMAHITDPEILRSLTYEQITEEEEDNQNEFVKLTAFFTRDLDGDGYAEKMKGTCREVSATDELYIDFNVLTDGYFKDGVITLNAPNFTWKTSIISDNIVKGNYLGNTTAIKLQDKIAAGSQKTLWGTIRANIGNNINNYSNEATITLTGTHVSDDGVTETPIEKTVKVVVDWYGSVGAQIYGTKINRNITELQPNDEGIEVKFSFNTKEPNSKLLLKENVATVEIPQLNGFNPINITMPEDYVYDETTRTITVKRSSVIDENGKITKTLARSNSYEIAVKYPKEAYTEELEKVTLTFPIKTYYVAYNNSNEQFGSPLQSKIAEDVVSITYRKVEPPVVTPGTEPTLYYNFNVEVGKSTMKGNIISKEKPLQIYNSQVEETTEDYYDVVWEAYISGNKKIETIIMKESPEKYTDEFFNNAEYTSMLEYIDNVGIYFSNAKNILGENGYINVYNDETNELIHSFTNEDWASYSSSNMFKYETSIKHIRVETSEVVGNGELYINHIKEINDELLVEKIAKEDFDKFKYIYSHLQGQIKLLDSDEILTQNIEGRAQYAEKASRVELTASPVEIETQKTYKNYKLTIKTQKMIFNDSDWKNGQFIIEFPEEIIHAEINNVTINNSAVEILGYDLYEQDGRYLLKIITKNDEETTYNISVDCNITATPAATTSTRYFTLNAYNEIGEDYYSSKKDDLDVNGNNNRDENIGYSRDDISFIVPSNIITSQYLSDYNDQNTIKMAPNVVELERENKTANVNIVVLNNYNRIIDEVKIVGVIPTQGNTYIVNGEQLGSEFSTIMDSNGIQVPEELKDVVTIYYSENLNVTKDLNDANNGWKKNPDDWSKIKTYLIDFGDYIINGGTSFEFSYGINIEDVKELNKVSYSEHAIFYALNTDGGKLLSSTEPSKLGIRVAKYFGVNLTKYKSYTNTAVGGATYKIIEKDKDGTVLNTKLITTEEDGKAIVNRLYVDKKYVLQEVVTPNYYELNNDEIEFYVTEEDNGELQITITSEDKFSTEPVINNEEDIIYVTTENMPKYNLVLNKISTTGEKIQNVRFDIKEKNRFYKTNENGQILLEDLIPNEIYTLVEKKAEGYFVDGTEKTFKLVYNKDKVEIETNDQELKDAIITNDNSLPYINVEATITNQKIPTYNLQVLKVAEDDDTNTGLQGAKIQLYDEEKNNTVVLTTDASGIVDFGELYAHVEGKNISGKYTIKEIEAPNGYTTNLENITFIVNSNAGNLSINIEDEEQLSSYKTNVIEGNIVKIIIQDKPLFKVTKVDSETGEPLANVDFVIYEYDENEQKIDFAKDVNENYVGEKSENGDYIVTTDENGNITLPLGGGFYKIEEVGFPIGYEERITEEMFKVSGKIVRDTNEIENKEEIIEINYIEDLIKLSNEVNSGDSKAGKTIKLMRILDFEDNDSYINSADTSFGDLNKDGSIQGIRMELTDKVDGVGFTPIGNSTNPFSGKFDGQGYEIKNIYIYDQSYSGLFGYVSDGMIFSIKITGYITDKTGSGMFMYKGGLAGYVKNSFIINCCNNVTIISNRRFSAGSVPDEVYVGGLVGFLEESTIKNCSNMVSIKGENAIGGIVGIAVGDSVIQNSFNIGDVTGRGDVAGILGIVGVSGNSNKTKSVNIKNCYNEGTILDKAEYGYMGNCHSNVAGILASGGYNSDRSTTNIINCYNTGDIKNEHDYSRTTVYAGGIAGLMKGNISNSYNIGDVQADRGSDSIYYGYVGGIIGSIDGKINNCYNTGDMQTNSCYIAGIVADINTDSIINNTYNIGNIYSNSNAGTILYNKDNRNYTMNNTYYIDTMKINGTTIDYNGIPVSNTKMLSKEFYNTLNIENAWIFRTNKYPVLASIIPENLRTITELTITNTKKEFTITTEILENSIGERAGGTISGEYNDSYLEKDNIKYIETVKYGNGNQNIIEINAKKDYTLSEIIINGQNIEYKINENGNVTIPAGYFEDVKENKHIAVVFEPKDNLIITKVDENDNNIKLEGAKFKIEQESLIDTNGLIGEIQQGSNSSTTHHFSKVGTTYQSTNTNISNSVCTSYFPIDLTNYLGKTFTLKINASISSESVSYDYGYARITTNSTVPAYTDTTGQIFKIGGTNVSTQTYTTTLQGGQKYYLHIGYRKDGSINSGTDKFTINTINLTTNDTMITLVDEIETNSEGIASLRVENNKEYIITEVEAPKDYELNIQSQQVTIAPEEMKNITITNKKVEKAGNLKITKVDADDNNIKLQGVEFEVKRKPKDIAGVLGTLTDNGTYVFKENNGVYTPNNKGINGSTANSYLKIDLTGKTGKYNLIVNAQVSSENSCDVGYAAVTENSTAPAFNRNTDVTGQFIKISGTSNIATDYSYINLEGGKVYYLHFSYMKDGSVHSGSDLFTVNSIRVEEVVESTVVTTNNEGIAQIPLHPEEYIIKEIKAPEGYILNEEIQTIVVASGNNEITINNSLKKFNITTKVEKTPTQHVDGGTISGKDEQPYEEVKYKKTSIKDILINPDDGYKIISIKINGEQIQFTPDADGNVLLDKFADMQEDKEVIVRFAPIYESNFTLKKIDELTNEPLEGIQFAIYYLSVGNDFAKDKNGLYVGEQDENGMYLVTTDENGEIKLSLPTGEYKAVEIKGKDGYVLDEKEEDRTTYFKVVYNADLEINYIEDLIELSNNVTNGNTYEGKIISLTRNLDFNDVNSYRNANDITTYGDYNGDGIVESIKDELTNTESSGFKPIGGNTENLFKGIFDGNGYELKNIYINSSYGSLFTNVENGEILNLKLTNASITNQSCGAGFAYYLTNSKMYNCGIDGVVLSSTNAPTAGLVYTTKNSEIVSCYNNADITGVCTGGISSYIYNSLIEKCYNTGNLTSVGSAGGLGYTVENCSIKDFYNTGDATSTSGGVSGIGTYMTKCTVVNSYNTGNITGKSTCGGIASNLIDSTIENCYNTGNITDTSAPAGGIAYNISNCTITNFYNTGDVSGASGAGGFSQSASNSTFTNCYNEGNIVSPNSSAGGLITYLSNSSLTKCFNKGTVTAEQGSIAGGVAATISGSELHQCFNESAVSSGSAPAGGFAYSIDKSTITECYNLGNVTSGVTGSTVGVAGFAVNASNSKINNCYNKGNINTTLYAAGLIGYDKNNTIENCYNEGQILAASCAGGITYESTNSTLKNIINKGTISSSGPSGGIVYMAKNCNIEKCANIAEIRTNAPAGGVVYTLYDSTLIKSYNTAEVYGPSCAGGVVEYASNSLIQDCYNTGNVISTVPAGGVVYSMSSTTVNNCYNTGDVSGNYGVGGVVGYGGTGCTINNCYNIGTVVAGTSSTGNPIGGVIYSPSGTTIKDTYYLSTSAPTGIYNQADVSGVTDSKSLIQMNARTFTKQLNDNKAQILTTIPLSDWKHNTSGCPVLDYTIDLDSFVIDVDDILNDASQKIDNNLSNDNESNNTNNQPTIKPSYEIVDSELTITNSKTAKVIVHHYLEGTGPEFENEPIVLASDEIIMGKENYDYITAPNLNIEGYTLIKDVNGEYIIPENATGRFTVEDQHIYYYYNVKPLELIVHHYLEGTEDKLVDDEQYFYNENDHYKTTPSQEILKSYDLVEVVGDEEKDITQNEVVTYYYKKKEYKITTKVVIPESEAEAGRTEKGGTILGEGEDPYEIVKHGENSKNDIIATPDEGYKLGSITVNGKVVPFTSEDGKIEIEKFENMTEDKEVIVEFIPIVGKVITHHYLQGTTEKLHEDIINIDKVGAVVATGPIDIEDYKLVDSAGNKDENGNVVIVKEINEGVEEIIYYYQRAYIITTDVIEHKEKYKDGTEKTGIKGGNITNEDVVIHEQVIKYNDSTKVIEMKPDDEYEVIEVRVNGQVVAFEKAGSGSQSGSVNQDGVEMSTKLELDKDGNLVIPEGFFTNVQKDIHVEVQYRRKSKVIVKYLENDTEKVLAEDTEIVGYEGKEFETAVKIIPGYTLVMEVVSDDDQDENQEETIKITDENYDPTEPNGTMFSDDITVIYWYEKIDANVIERHIEIDAKGEQTELEFVVYNDKTASTVETLRKQYEGYASTNAPEETVNKHTNVTFVDKEENKSTVTVDNTKVKEVWYYYIKQYNITTEVKPHKQTIDGVQKEVEGGTISKQFKIDENGKEVEDIYEVVDNRADSKKEIKMVPEDGYRIKSVTINDEEFFIDNMVAEDGSLLLPVAYFKDVQKDYHVVVEYERIPAKVIVQYIDEFTKESILPDKVIDGFVHDEYNEPRPEIDSYIAVNPEPENSQGKMVEGVITIVYYYGKQYRITTDVIEHLEDEKNFVDVIVDKTDDTVDENNGSKDDENGDGSEDSVDSENSAGSEDSTGSEGSVGSEDSAGSEDSVGSEDSAGSGNETNPDSPKDPTEGGNDTVIPEGKILVKGGSIQGEDEQPYEAVSRGENNIKEILIKPDDGYRIKSLKIKDGETEFILSVPDLLTEENTIILPKEYFKNMQSDKHIMVEFEPIPAKVVVNYLDIATKENEKQEKVSTSEEGNGFVNNEYKTYAKDIAYYELVKEEIPANSTGKLTEKDTVVNYWYRKLLFNMKLTKELSSVQVNGEERLEQDKKFVKIDIANADVNNTNILVKYKIIVTNTEKVEGVAKIVEDIPDGFKYIAENVNGSQWIEVDGKLELTTKTLKPGEAVEYEITLEWDKDQKSVGRLINTATITETQNIPGYEETTKEDNEDMAIVEIKINKTVSDVIGDIISDVKTGDVIIVSIMTLVIAGAVLVITIKKRK